VDEQSLFKKEESLSTIGLECRLIAGQGNLTESATESIPPYGKGEMVR